MPVFELIHIVIGPFVSRIGDAWLRFE